MWVGCCAKTKLIGFLLTNPIDPERPYRQKKGKAYTLPTLTSGGVPSQFLKIHQFAKLPWAARTPVLAPRPSGR